MKKKDYSAAIYIFKEILSQNKLSKKEYARTLSNLSYTKWLQNPKYNPKPELFKALEIRKLENDLWGQNASYARLADYYMNRDPDSALYYANNMYTVAKEIQSP